MNIYLLFLICALSIFQTGRDKTPAVTYAIICAGHTVVFGGLEGSAYFLSAAIADALIIMILCFGAGVSRLADILISISLLSGAVNAAGCLAWHLGIPSDAYYYSCLTLYTLATLAMIRKEGGFTNGGSLCNRFFRSLGRPGYALRCALHEAAK